MLIDTITEAMLSSIEMKILNNNNFPTHRSNSNNKASSTVNNSFRSSLSAIVDNSMDSYRQSFLYVLQHNHHHHHNRYPHPHHHDVIDELLQSPIYQYTHTRKLIKIVGINDDHSNDDHIQYHDNHLQRNDDGHDPSYHTDDDDHDDDDDDDDDDEILITTRYLSNQSLLPMSNINHHDIIYHNNNNNKKNKNNNKSDVLTLKNNKHMITSSNSNQKMITDTNNNIIPYYSLCPIALSTHYYSPPSQLMNVYVFHNLYHHFNQVKMEVMMNIKQTHHLIELFLFIQQLFLIGESTFYTSIRELCADVVNEASHTIIISSSSISSISSIIKSTGENHQSHHHDHHDRHYYHHQIDSSYSSSSYSSSSSSILSLGSHDMIPYTLSNTINNIISDHIPSNTIRYLSVRFQSEYKSGISSSSSIVGNQTNRTTTIATTSAATTNQNNSNVYDIIYTLLTDQHHHHHPHPDNNRNNYNEIQFLHLITSIKIETYLHSPLSYIIDNYHIDQLNQHFNYLLLITCNKWYAEYWWKYVISRNGLHRNHHHNDNHQHQQQHYQHQDRRYQQQHHRNRNHDYELQQQQNHQQHKTTTTNDCNTDNKKLMKIKVLMNMKMKMNMKKDMDGSRSRVGIVKNDEKIVDTSRTRAKTTTSTSSSIHNDKIDDDIDNITNDRDVDIDVDDNRSDGRDDDHHHQYQAYLQAIQRSKRTCQLGLHIWLHIITTISNAYMTHIHGKLYANFIKYLAISLSSSPSTSSSSPPSCSILQVKHELSILLQEISIVLNILQPIIITLLAHSFTASYYLHQAIILENNYYYNHDIKSNSSNSNNNDHGDTGENSQHHNKNNEDRNDNDIKDNHYLHHHNNYPSLSDVNIAYQHTSEEFVKLRQHIITFKQIITQELMKTSVNNNNDVVNSSQLIASVLEQLLINLI